MAEQMSIAALAPRVKSGELSAERLVGETLARIGTTNARINAFITVLADEGMAEARRLDADRARGRYHGPLHGMPISVKDLVDVRGVPTTAASRVRRGHVALQDAAVVSRLRSAGAIIIGKTNLHEFAYGTTSEDSAYGAVRNPRDTSRSAGGSSGGSAAALAAGLCAGSVGTDTGGSIRIPAAACGIVGLKPTYGEIPIDGIVPLSRSLDHAGPMATDVASTWLLYQAMAGLPVSSTTVGAEAAGRATAGGAVPLRLAVPRRYFLDLLDNDVRQRFEHVLDTLRQAGADVSEAEIPHADLIATVYLHIQLPESSAYHAAALERNAQLYVPSIRLRLEMGRYVLAEDYVRAQRGREVLQREVDQAIAPVDALVLPTLPIPAPALGQANAELGQAELPVRGVMLRLTQLFDITGHPAISLPAGETRGALPVGLQLVGQRDRTADLLRVAMVCEELLRHAVSR